MFLAARRFGLVQEPQTPEGQKRLGELAVRFFLFLSVASVYGVILSRRSLRTWFTARRWRLLMLVLFPVGAAFAMADPFHAISHEENWIRYWTAGVLAVAGGIALANALRRVHPAPDRLFGAAFGCLLILAGADEVFQFHEQAALESGGSAQGDTTTLAVAVLGLLGLAGLFLIRRMGGWLGRLLREERFRLPLRLLTLAVLAFLLAMSIDSLDVYLEEVVADAAHGGFWTAVTDVVRLANATEELLEYFTALALLMTVGTLFSVKVLGCAPKAPDTAAA